MNGKQKLIRVIGLTVLLLIALFPPWQLSYTLGPAGEAKSHSLGYFPLWSPPSNEAEVEEENASNIKYRVDFLRVGLQLLGALALINLGVYVLKSKPAQA
jgi:hypothetical protein